MEITYRTGQKEDCPKLAEFVYMASDGVVEYLFHDLIEGVSPVQIVAHNLVKDSGYYTYRNTIVAESGPDVVGASFHYPSRYHGISEQMRQFFPSDRLEHLKHILGGRIEESLYLDTLCVDKRYRNNGIGGELISMTKEKAARDGFPALSLITLADNTAAHRL